MTVYVLFEDDFGTSHIVSVYSNLDKARTERLKLESEDHPDWISYHIEEWEVSK